MKKRLFVLNVLLLYSLCTLYSQNPKNSLNVKEYTLSNGLTVWLNEDKSQPKVIGSVIVKAGAKHSPNTGIAHYFEHIMFKGTDKIGTINFEEEKVWLDSISIKYDELAQTTDNSKRLEIQKEINNLSIKAAQYVIPNEFNRLISQYGGTGLNAGTSWDFTMYFNTFLPQYLTHWCELNSERLINPVFRMFQSELETVYEEKNMYADVLGSKAAEKIVEAFFKPHPYQYPIIGSTENLKNPQLSKMEEFFNTYYVAENMGLILSGHFDAEKVLPVLEKTFGKIKRGSINEQELEMPEPIIGKKNLKIKFPIPFVRANALLWRGVPSNHPDEAALNLVMSFLSNENKTGLLDKLTIDGKLMMAAGLSLSMNDAGAIALIAIPNIPFQTYRSAQKHIFNSIDKVKRGAISDEMFQGLKLEQQRKRLLELESLDKRNQKMIEVFAKGLSWNDYLEQTKAFERITKEEVIAIANKYFTNNYFDVKKKTGKYPNDKIEKPPFKPIQTVNKEKESEYSKWLETIESTQFTPQYLDLENDVITKKLSNNNLVTLYHTGNKMNNVFDLTLQFEVGSRVLPTLSPLASYLNYVGTDTYSVDQFNQKLQELGSTLSFNASPSQFTITVSGFDNAFEETVSLLTHFLTHLEADRSKLKKVIEERKLQDKAIRKSSEALGKAMVEKVKYGENSDFITRLSLKELRKTSTEQFLYTLQRTLSTQCAIHYSGTLSDEVVADVMETHFPVNNVNLKSDSSTFREGQKYSNTHVFFFNDAKATQSIVQGYVFGPSLNEVDYNFLPQLFNTYFGSGMSSLMFQEIREFRSLAYRASSTMQMPPVKEKEKSMLFNMLLSTQADKTIDAIVALQSLLIDMPLSEKRLEAAKESLIYQAQSAYPNFRDKSKRIARYTRQGYTDDPNKLLVNEAMELSLKDVEQFYKQYIEGETVVYVIIGNKKKINMKQLQQIGAFKEMKLKEFLK